MLSSFSAGLVPSLHSIQIFMLAGGGWRGRISCRWRGGARASSSAAALVYTGFMRLHPSTLDQATGGGGFVIKTLQRELGWPKHGHRALPQWLQLLAGGWCHPVSPGQALPEIAYQSLSSEIFWAIEGVDKLVLSRTFKRRSTWEKLLWIKSCHFSNSF